MLAGKIGYFRATAHPEALAWQTRVVANGGTVSASTLAAVSNFCVAIDAAGIRNRLFRANLFCGTGLSAALVPLYRGPSPSGTQFGDSTDTNINFVAGDYAETGASGGLKANGSNTWLNTGLPLNFNTTRHIGVVLQNSGQSGGYLLGAWGASGNASIFGIYTQANLNMTAFNFSDAAASGSAGNNAPTLRRSVIASSTPGAGGLQLFVNGSSVGTGTAFSTTNTGPISIFGLRRSNAATPELITTARLSAYTIGDSLNAAQAAALNTALTNFNAALARDRASADPAFAAVTNADARLWIDNVYNNGGTVSTTTATAVNNFCAAIDAAGIRDRFYRLNLFCGDNLAAALVPLYRGTSAAGSQLGNGTDTNSNFVSGDYSLAGGMNNSTGASTKFLSTGLAPNALPQLQTGHMSCAIMSYTSGSGFAMGVQQANRFNSTFFVSNASSMSVGAANFTGDFGAATASPIGRWLATRSSDTSGIGYRNAVQAISQTASQSTRLNGATTFGIFGRSLSGDPAVASAVQGASVAIRIGAYSIGDNLTAQQVTSFDTALTNFFTAIGRS